MIEETTRRDAIIKARIDREAACADFYAETAYDAWYGPEGSDKGMYPTADEWKEERTEAKEAAIRVCKRCPVRDLCLGYVMRHELPGQRYGIWGGLTPTSRAHLATRMAAANAA